MSFIKPEDRANIAMYMQMLSPLKKRQDYRRFDRYRSLIRYAIHQAACQQNLDKALAQLKEPELYRYRGLGYGSAGVELENPFSLKKYFPEDVQTSEDDYCQLLCKLKLLIAFPKISVGSAASELWIDRFLDPPEEQPELEQLYTRIYEINRREVLEECRKAQNPGLILLLPTTPNTDNVITQNAIFLGVPINVFDPTKAELPLGTEQARNQTTEDEGNSAEVLSMPIYSFGTQTILKVKMMITDPEKTKLPVDLSLESLLYPLPAPRFWYRRPSDPAQDTVRVPVSNNFNTNFTATPVFSGITLFAYLKNKLLQGKNEIQLQKLMILLLKITHEYARIHALGYVYKDNKTGNIVVIERPEDNIDVMFIDNEQPCKILYGAMRTTEGTTGIGLAPAIGNSQAAQEATTPLKYKPSRFGKPGPIYNDIHSAANKGLCALPKICYYAPKVASLIEKTKHTLAGLYKPSARSAEHAAASGYTLEAPRDLEYVQTIIIPRLRNKNVLLGVCAPDPTYDMQQYGFMILDMLLSACLDYGTEDNTALEDWFIKNGEREGWIEFNRRDRSPGAFKRKHDYVNKKIITMVNELRDRLNSIDRRLDKLLDLVVEMIHSYEKKEMKKNINSMIVFSWLIDIALDFRVDLKAVDLGSTITKPMEYFGNHAYCALRTSEVYPEEVNA